MEKIITLFICFVLLFKANAQKSFQGEIIYKLHASMDDKPDAQLKVLFGVNKLKLFFKEKDDYDKDALIVLFDSSATFILNHDNKTYKKKLLQLNTPIQKPEKKSITGYTTTPLVPETNTLGNLLGGLISTSKTVFYVADSLSFFVPDIFTGNTELVMIQKNKIVLGADVNIKDNVYGTADDKAQHNNLITAEAIEIKSMAISDSEFIIPANYINAKDLTSPPDSITAMMDTTAAVMLPQKPTPKRPIKSPKPKSPIKSSAVRRKE